MCAYLRGLCAIMIEGEGMYLSLVGPGCDKCVWGWILLWYLCLMGVYVVSGWLRCDFYVWVVTVCCYGGVGVVEGGLFSCLGVSLYIVSLCRVCVMDGVPFV